MIKNDAGQVAMIYFQTVPQIVKLGKDVTYNFIVKHNVCLAWVNEAHVQAILDIVKVCCGGSRNRVYRLANEMQVRVWSGISER